MRDEGERALRVSALEEDGVVAEGVDRGRGHARVAVCRQGIGAGRVGRDDDDRRLRIDGSPPRAGGGEQGKASEREDEDSGTHEAPTLKTVPRGIHSRPEFALARRRFTTAVARMGRTLGVLVTVCLITGRLHSTPSGLPPIPPLPADGWPLQAAADAFARLLIARVPPGQLESMVAASPDTLPAVFRNLGTALLSHDVALREALK